MDIGRIDVRALLVMTAALSGCGGPHLAPVTGRVTLDGEPLADARVSFVPIDESGVPTLGTTGADGVYTLRQTADQRGAPPGRYTVRITTYREGQADADPPVPEVPEKVPRKYNLQTTLSAEVGPKENILHFALESDPQTAGKGSRGSNTVRPAAGTGSARKVKR